jgi:hypothetical protein
MQSQDVLGRMDSEKEVKPKMAEERSTKVAPEMT